MIEKIKNIVKLRKELKEEWKIIEVRKEFVQVSGYDNLKNVAKELSGEIYVESRDDKDYPYESFFYSYGYRFLALMTEKDYKKATAPTVTSDKS